MNAHVAGWGVIWLIIFSLAHYLVPATLSEQYMWIGIAVIFLVLGIVMSKKMEGGSESSKSTWMTMNVFGLIVTIVIAMGFVNLPLSWLMSLWMFLLGAGLFAEGHETGVHHHTYSGLVLIVASLSVPAFAGSYFLAGTLFIGLGALLSGVFMAPKEAKK